jgi:hypothetical protein
MCDVSVYSSGVSQMCGDAVVFGRCVVMLWFWMHIFDRYYKSRWPKEQAAPRRAAVESMERQETLDDDSAIELMGEVMRRRRRRRRRRMAILGRYRKQQPS